MSERTRRPGRSIDAAEVRAALTRGQIVERFELKASGPDGGWWRGHTCPACKKHWRVLAGSGFCLSPRGWVCKACGAKGDLLDLLARLAGLDIRQQFPQVLELGAELAGARPADDPATRYRRLAERDRVERTQKAQEVAAAHEQRRLARQTAPNIWDDQRADHLRGRRYLEGRGLDVDTLIERDLVRFGPVGWRSSDLAGDPTIALHDWDGVVVNVVRRRMARDEPKAPGLKGHPTDGTLVGHVGEILRGARVIVTEGVIDSLTAAVAWPGAVVLGAHGAAQMPAVVAAAAPRVRTVGGQLFIVPDPDQPGQDAAVEAAGHALVEGFSVDRDLHFIELGDCDLNDAWCAGWRP